MNLAGKAILTYLAMPFFLNSKRQYYDRSVL